jgi:hypothetical protein
MDIGSADFSESEALVEFQGAVAVERAQSDWKTFLGGGVHHLLEEGGADSLILPAGMDHQFTDVDVIGAIFHRCITARRIIAQNDVELGAVPITIEAAVLVSVIPRAKLRDHHVAIRAMMRFPRESRVRVCRWSGGEPHE